MAKQGDTRVRAAGEEVATEEGYERASDLYAPRKDIQDLSDASKVTLRSYLRKTLQGNGPAASESTQAKNAYMPPEEGSESNEGSFTQTVDGEVDQTRLSSIAGRENWKVGHDKGASSNIRTPFLKIINELSRKYPLGKYIPPLTAADKETRPGTLENAVISLAGSIEKQTAIGGANPHTAVRSPADFQPTTIPSAVSHALSYNRFNPTAESPLVVSGEKTGLGWSLQRGNLGYYDPTDPSPKNDVLSQLGRNLIALQTGHDGDAPFPTVAAIIPTLTQLGLANPFGLSDLYGIDPLDTRKNYTHLRGADDGIGTLRLDRGPSGTPLSGPGNRRSYGALNSHLEPFEGSFGIFLIVAIQLVALIVLGFLLTLLFGEIRSDDVRSDWRKDLRGNEMAFGKFRSRLFEKDYKGGSGSTVQFIKDTFDFPNEIVYRFDKAFYEGLQGFLGVDIESFDPVDAFKALWKSSGFLATTVRFVMYDMMDWQELADTWSGAGSRFLVDALFKTFDVMASSHTIKFVFTMAKLGDATLSIEDGMTRNAQRGFAAGLPISNSKFLGAASAGGLFLGSLKLQGMSNIYGSPDLAGYLAPTGDKAKLEEEMKHIRSGDTQIFRLDAKTPYIPREQRVHYEQALDGTYCPFYFHDLRTGEIISFHAFMTNLTDSYAANYTDITGIGRVEAAKIYASTSRTISVTFKVFAVTVDDMDEMWLKINRLVTMVYPQYTAGRAVQVDGKILRAPFSQHPAATPFIRLRVGDVIGTNGSEMGLARLYGLTGEAPDGDGLAPGAVGENGSELQSGRSSEQARAALGEQLILRGHERLYYCNDLAYPVGITVAEMVKLINSDKKSDHITLPIRATISHVKLTDGGMKIGVIDFDGSKSGSNDTPTLKEDVQKVISAKENAKSVIDPNFHKPGTHVHEKTVDDMMVDPRETKALLPFPPLDIKIGVPNMDVEPGPGRGFVGTHFPGTKKTHPVTKIDFSNADNAPSLLKSFRERGGKGLPGVITAIDLGNFVSDDTTWGVEQGYRAPKFLEVTIAFSPVHDIPPGLDSGGQMTAAQYGVGGSRAFNKGDL